jgi:hypothetical protein
MAVDIASTPLSVSWAKFLDWEAKEYTLVTAEMEK